MSESIEHIRSCDMKEVWVTIGGEPKKRRAWCGFLTVGRVFLKLCSDDGKFERNTWVSLGNIVTMEIIPKPAQDRGLNTPPQQKRPRKNHDNPVISDIVKKRDQKGTPGSLSGKKNS